MSRTRQNTQLKSPCEMFIKWSGAEGCWMSYDKDKKENVKIPYGIRFLFLDQLATMTGYSDSLQAGIWSNEVRSVKNQKLMVHVGKKLAFTGLYADAKVSVQGGKYAQSVYALALIEGDYRLINIKLYGASLTAWIDFQASVGGSRNLEANVAVVCSGVEDKKKGATKYKVPIFETLLAEKDEEDLAAIADNKLQKYLDDYLALGAPNVSSTEEDEIQNVIDEDVGF